MPSVRELQCLVLWRNLFALPEDRPAGLVVKVLFSRRGERSSILSGDIKYLGLSCYRRTDSIPCRMLLHISKVQRNQGFQSQHYVRLSGCTTNCQFNYLSKISNWPCQLSLPILSLRIIITASFVR
jgi:hypothetical protein